jgi:hypothetical protein
MEPQEVDRAIQFLLAQQAQFAADLQQSRELSDQRHDHVTQAILGVTTVLGHLVGVQAEQAKRHDVLAAEVREMMDRQLRELAEAQKETQGNLNALILVVEKYF